MKAGTQVKGLFLALTTVLFWGTLPIALKQVTTTVDPTTIVWIRFTTGALWLWLRLPRTKSRRSSPGLYSGRVILLLGVAAAGLGGNFVLYNASVACMSASACQIVAQAGPMLLMLGSVLVLGETLHRVQTVGVVMLLLGLGLFFNERLGELLQLSGGYGLGLALGITAAAVWAVYGLAQRILLREMPPPRLMRILYTCCALALFPFASPQLLLRLDTAQGLCLAYCCLNTLVAYGAFSRAMSCWDTARVSAILTLTPLCTLAFARLFHLFAPTFFPADPLNWPAIGGAAAVVCGAALMAVGPVLHLPLLSRRHCEAASRK